MDNGIKISLEVNALRETIRRDKDALFVFPKSLHPSLTLFRRQRSRNDFNLVVFECSCQGGAYRLSGRDKPAKHDR